MPHRRLLPASLIVVALGATGVLLAQGIQGDTPYSDVASGHPYAAAIAALSERGVLQGYPDGTFGPDSPVSRAEMVKIALAFRQIPTDGTVPTEGTLTDVDRSQWYAPYVATAVAQGMVTGYPDGTFGPARGITRVEGLTMLYRLLQPTPGAQLPGTATSRYRDTDAAAWYAPYTDWAIEEELIDPIAGLFQPARPMARGEVAELLYRTLQPDKTANEGIASYYGRSFDGRNTASGQRFHNDAYSTAHKTLPFGTVLYIAHPDTGRGSFVRVNDRGPFAIGREVDLSQAAFTAVYPLAKGVGPVRITRFGGDWFTEKRIYGTDTWTGLTLDEPLPGLFLPGELLAVSGQAVEGTVRAVLYRGDDIIASQDIAVDGDGRWAATLGLPAGVTGIALFAPGAESSSVAAIAVLPAALEAPAAGATPAQLAGGSLQATTSPTGEAQLQLQHTAVASTQGRTVYRFTLSQPGATNVVLYSTSALLSFGSTARTLLAGFGPGSISVQADAALSATPFTMDRYTPWQPVAQATLQAVAALPGTVRSGAQATPLPTVASAGSPIAFQLRSPVPLAPQLYATLPGGAVQALPLSVTTVGSSTTADISFTPPSAGSYQLEVNDEQGLAVINIPLYAPEVLPLLPSSLDAPVATDDVLAYVNTQRAAQGMGPLVGDDSLMRLAQRKANDMLARGYVAHVDPDGKDINDLRATEGVRHSLAENIALERNTARALAGLWYSGSHRRTWLQPGASAAGWATVPQGSGTLLVLLVGQAEATAAEEANASQGLAAELARLSGAQVSADDGLASLLANDYNADASSSLARSRAERHSCRQSRYYYWEREYREDATATALAADGLASGGHGGVWLRQAPDGGWRAMLWVCR